jgi:hypothetical protein
VRNTCKSDGGVGFGQFFSGGRVRNTWMTYPGVGDTRQKCRLRPHVLVGVRPKEESCELGNRLAAPEAGSAAD